MKSITLQIKKLYKVSLTEWIKKDQTNTAWRKGKGTGTIQQGQR